MRFPFPRSLPSWLLTILISGLLITQIATLWIVSQDRKEANYALELFRLSERATSLVKLLNTTPVSDWNSLASRLASSGQGLTITAQPDVPTVLASEEDLAELEDVLVARLARYGVIDARIRRDKLAHGPHATVVPTADSGDIGDVEKQINDLAATANLGASLTTSLQFGDGRWINFTTRITPADPIITTETIPLFALVALSVVLVAIWATRRLTAP